MGKIAIYTRVSTIKQLDTEGDSLKVQREACENMMMNEYKKTKEDFLYFVDEGISAKSSEKRDAFLEMVDMIQNQDEGDDNFIDGICCFNLSRLSRSLKFTMEIFDILKSNTLKLYTYDKTFNGSLTDQNNMIMASIFGMLNELYLLKLRETVIPSMKEAADKGFTQGGMPPLGYDYLQVQNDNGDYRGIYVINEKEAEIVKYMFSMYVNHRKSLYTITKELNEEGYKTKTHKQRKGTSFSTNTVINILSNPAYIGKVVWGKNMTTSLQKINGVRKKEVRIFTEDEIRNANGNHQPIIEEDTFFEAQNRMNKRKKTRNNENMSEKRKGVQQKDYYEDNRRIFSNVLKCPECNSRMTSSPNYKRDKEGNITEAKYTYICTAYNAGKSNCKGYYRVGEQQIYKLIREDFISRIENQYKLVKMYLDYNISTDEEKLRYLEEVNPGKTKKLERLRENLKRLTKDLDAIVELTIEYKDNKRMQGIYLKKSQELDKELDVVESKITGLINEIKQEKEQKKVLLLDMQETENEDSFEAYYNNLNMDKQRKLIEQVYKTIVIDTEAKRSGKQKSQTLKYTKLNDDFSIRRITEILGIDFKEFYRRLSDKGIELPLITKYFSDAEEFTRILGDMYNENGTRGNRAKGIIEDYVNNINEKYKEQILENENQDNDIETRREVLLEEELDLDKQIGELTEKIKLYSCNHKDKKLVEQLKQKLAEAMKHNILLILENADVS